MKEYLSSCEEVLKEQNSSEQGLSTGEARRDCPDSERMNWKKGKRLLF